MKNIVIFCLSLIFLGCKPDLPEIMDVKIASIDCGQNWAKVNAVVINTTGKEIKEQGVEMGVEMKFKRIISTSLDKDFSITISDLKPNTKYKVRPYIISSDDSVAFGEYKEFTTLDYQRFIISGAKIKNLVAWSGEVYVSGTFHNQKIGFVAKFNADGTLSWLKNVPNPADYSYPVGEMVVSSGVVYTNVIRNDTQGLGNGIIYLDAYEAATGNLKWSLKLRDDKGTGTGLKIDADGNIWSVMSSAVALVSKSGILMKYNSIGIGISDFIFMGSDFLFVGSNDGEAMIKKLDKDFNLIFSKTFGVTDKPSNIQDLVYFPNANLLILGRFSGSLDGLGGAGNPELDLIAYEVLGDNFNLKWEKKFPKTYSIMFACNSPNDFYLSSDNSQTAIGPAKVSLEGNVSQLANSKNGRITLSGSKIFLADGGEKLTIY